RTEDDSAMPFCGQAGEEVKESLTKAGIAGSYAFINSVRCRPTDSEGNGRAPTEEEIAACRNYAQQDLVQLKPKVVVLMGNTAKDVLGPNEWKTKSINKIKGETLTSEGITYTATVNPGSFLRSDNYIEKQRFHRHIGNV